MKSTDLQHYPPFDTDSCWLYAGTLTLTGYGVIGQELAHRVMYAQTRELVPGLEIDHLCRTRQCINPDHLELVTHEENMMRARKKYCAHGHEWKPEIEVWYMLKGYRVRGCKLCREKNSKKSYERRKAQNV